MAKRPVSKKPLIVAIDDGYAAIKGRGFAPNGRDIVDFRISSNLVRGAQSLVDGSRTDNSYETFDEKRKRTVTFSVTDTEVSSNMAFDNYHFSPQIRILITHALAENGFGDQPVDLWLSLPVSDYYNRDGSKNSDKINRKVESIYNEVVSLSGRPLADIQSVTVVPQAIVAILNNILDDNLDDREEYLTKNNFCVIDIGGRTTDIGYMTRPNASSQLQLSPTHSDSINEGVLHVHDELVALLRDRFPSQKAFSPRTIDNALRTKEIAIGDDIFDIKELCETASHKSADNIIDHINRVLSNAVVDEMMLIGGGAEVFADVIKEEFPTIKLIENPDTANAQGIFKYARLVRAATGQ